jgi:X-X-X-Leu-X-X-Gly heptad repeat protein
MKFWRVLVALLATSLMIGLAATPASAADDGAKATAAAKKKKGPSTRKLNSDLRKVRTRTTRAERGIRGINGAINALRSLSNGNKQGLDFLLAAAPQLVSGLTQLRDGSLQLRDGLVAAGNGLRALQTALETQVGPGLQAAGTAIRSTEYGFGQVLNTTGGAPTGEAGSFVQTPDIPDAVQQAQTTQQFVKQATGVVLVAYGVRSAESDGTGADNPAANCKVTVTAEEETNPAIPGAAEEGETATTAANPAFGGLPFQPVPEKSAQTSTDEANKGFPFGLKSSGADADKFTVFNSSLLIEAGDTYTVGLACVDTSPSATDPSA